MLKGRRLPALVAVTLAAACGGGDGDSAWQGSAATDPPALDWAQLQNPIYSLPDAAVKDLDLCRRDGRWRLYASHITGDPARFSLLTATSPDLVEWSEPRLVPGVASPDVSGPAGSAEVVTAQRYDDPNRAKLVVAPLGPDAVMRTTIDLPDDVHRVASSIARDQGTSLSEIVSRLVQKALSTESGGTVERSDRTGFQVVSFGFPITTEDVRALDDDQ